MNGQILGILGTLTGIIYIIGIVVISFAALLTAAEIFASITRIITRHRYRKGRKILSSSGYTGAEAARTFLDLNGLQNINVEIVGFWKGLFFGNTYSIKKQTIYLRKNVANQTNLTSIGLALKEVATAINCKNGDKKTIFMTKIKRVLPFVGFLLIPLIVVGLLIDYAVFSFEGFNYICSYWYCFLYSYIYYKLIACKNREESKQQSNWINASNKLLTSRWNSCYW